MPTNTSTKNLIILNLTPGDGDGNLVENGELLTQMEAMADGKPAIIACASGNQYHWIIDSTKMTAAKDQLDSFIGNHVFAETPSYAIIPTL
jgi:hypothetical protein